MHDVERAVRFLRSPAAEEGVLRCDMFLLEGAVGTHLMQGQHLSEKNTCGVFLLRELVSDTTR